ncbi:serine hydrolase [Flavihumibacter solisilvae]|uniref:Beta-lactamase n=1 Tax=Flavihumibacter solisilvae TaxID=1349421 RepID=A0A0C1L0V9_9BACT|nr:serine hydrolase [Flavihumibacter solisilvae]KIC93241.1 hypothetical protein OI18_18485 [Flavihumibacter solisilvae]
MKLLLSMPAVLLACSMQAQPKADQRLKGLDTFVNKVLKDWHTPGVSIAVVEKNRVVFTGGFGYRNYEQNLPVTSRTLFAIGSCTKAFTASMVGMLESEGLIDIDKPVRNYLPSLKFYNDDLNAHVTTRDMMCHRTGLPRHDIAWYGSSATRKELLERIQFLEPNRQLREVFQYNNFMFMAQGVLIEQLTGKSWEENLRQRILTPLGMNTTNMSVTEMEKSPDHSLAYAIKKDSIITAIPFRNLDAIGPAGAINSCADDMSKWLITWINGGSFHGKEIIPASFVTQATSQQMAVPGAPPSKENPDLHLGVSGLGWFLSSYRGHLRTEHGGGIDGFISTTCYFPTDSIGIFVVSSNGTVTNIVRNFIADRMLRLPYRNWNGMQKEQFAKGKAGNGKRVNTDSLTKKPGTKPLHNKEEYAGNYSHPGYGTARVFWDRDTLWLDYNSGKKINNYLQHYHYDVFRHLTIDEGEEDMNATKIRFVTGEGGDIEAFEVSMEQGVKDILFKKELVIKTVSRLQLEKFTGEYELQSVVLKVSLKGEKTLTLFVPGQPEYELVPQGENQFGLKGLQGFIIKFEVDNTGQVTALTSIQPNGIFTAVRKK